MRISVDRPPDRLIVDRVELLSGWVAPAAPGGFAFRAACGGREISLRPCWHPDARWSTDLQGFWGFVVLQELLDEVRHDYLDIDLFWDDARVEALHLRVSPAARDLARAYPINLADYAVPSAPARFAVDSRSTIVFPGLGAVGGASLNQLLRMKMLREDWPLTVYFEANDPSLWASACGRGGPIPRWIDGHACYAAADDLGVPFARVTLLREPVRRLLSIFHYNSLVHPYEFPFPTFDAFLDAGAATRFTQAAGLLRCAGIETVTEMSADELYRVARGQLRQHYALVGIMELFEETIFLLCQLAGYDSIGMWWKVLSAPNPPDVTELSSDTRKRLESLLAVDLLLYEEAKRDFLDLATARDLGADLQRYKNDAAARPELPDVYKLIECLRWRQILVDAEMKALKARATP